MPSLEATITVLTSPVTMMLCFSYVTALCIKMIKQISHKDQLMFFLLPLTFI